MFDIRQMMNSVKSITRYRALTSSLEKCLFIQRRSSQQLSRIAHRLSFRTWYRVLIAPNALLYITEVVFISYITTKHYLITCNAIQNLSQMDGKFPSLPSISDCECVSYLILRESMNPQNLSWQNLSNLRSESVRAGKDRFPAFKMPVAPRPRLICITWPILDANFQCQSCDIISWYICKRHDYERYDSYIQRYMHIKGLMKEQVYPLFLVRHSRTFYGIQNTRNI